MRQRVSDEIRQQLPDPRMRSQFTGRSIANSASITRPGEANLNSSTTCQGPAPAASRRRDSSLMPPPSRAAGEVEHIVDQPRHPHHRRLHHGDDLMLLFGLAVRSRMRAPALIEASGLRRSWPSTAMNCSRNSAVSCSLCRPLHRFLAAFASSRPREAPARSAVDPSP